MTHTPSSWIQLNWTFNPFPSPENGADDHTWVLATDLGVKWVQSRLMTEID